MYVILKNYINWHRENLRSDRENTGKTQGKYNLSGYPVLGNIGRYDVTERAVKTLCGEKHQVE